MGRCDECRFWRDVSKTSAIKFQDGVKECRRRAPVGAVQYGVAYGEKVRLAVVSSWAVTHADDGCGEFEPQGDAKP